MTTIKQVVVVEGRDDTKRLKETFGAIDTIETRGSAIDEATLERIRQAQAKRGVIVLTDPDFPGEKIRKTISRAVPGVTHAFLPRREGVPDHKGSLGIEHAKPAALRAALQHLFTEMPDAPQVISQQDLLGHQRYFKAPWFPYAQRLRSEFLDRLQDFAKNCDSRRFDP